MQSLFVIRKKIRNFCYNFSCNSVRDRVNAVYAFRRICILLFSPNCSVGKVVLYFPKDSLERVFV